MLGMWLHFFLKKEKKNLLNIVKMNWDRLHMVDVTLLNGWSHLLDLEVGSPPPTCIDIISSNKNVEDTFSLIKLDIHQYHLR